MTNNTTADLDRDIAHLIDSSENGIARVPRETLVRLRALLTSPRAAGLPEGWKLVPIERSYNMRAKALIAFNTTEKKTNDRDDALDAAHRAMLDAAPAAPVAELVMQPLTDAALREALDDFELVCENNDVRRLTDDEKYVAQEFALSLIHGDPSAAQAVAADGVSEDEPSEIEQVIACLGDDAAKLRDANPDDEMADNMDAAARLLSERAAIVEHCAKIADSFTYGSCGLDGWIGKSIRASQIPRAAVSPATAEQDLATEEEDPDDELAREEAYFRRWPDNDATHVEKPATADERAALQWTAGTLQEIVSGRWKGAKESDKVSIGSVTKTVAQVLDMADAALGRASQAAAPQAATTEESEDAYVIRRLSETLADVCVTLRGDDPVHADDPMNKIELVKRLAEVIRLEVELYRAQADAPADAREPFPYQKTFDAIAAATSISAGGYVSISVEAFRKAFGPVPDDAGEAVLTAAARDVLAERERQVSVEGWTPEHDDQYTKGELALAASQYVLHVACPFQDGKVPAFWPWAAEWWKPTTPRRDLEKAGALIQAEIERLYRAEAREQGAQGEKGGEA
ncbi:hypothetical protein QZL74_14355 [Burkholderia gladioli pv. alliicola]|uniref:hypothetical protein n=1 Tax=Burkholderia gladioli TaxID=28095 RepID=UPI003D8169C1